MTSSPKARRQVTATDVARRVGVDRSTVSLVLGGKAQGRVTPAVQEVVRQAADALGYRPQAAARALRLGQTEAVALVVPQATNPYFAPLLHGATVRARQSGYAVVLVDADHDAPDAQSHLIDVLARQAVAGLMLWTKPNSTELTAWRGRLVLMELEQPDVASVLLDVEHGAAQAARHLLELGHRHVAYLRGASNHPTFVRRHAATAAVLQAAGMVFVWEARSAFELDAAEQAARGLLASSAPTAVVCDDDLLAAGMYRAANAMGLRIPQDLSVVGFNDVDLARVLSPELTTVAADAAQVGAEAVTLLLTLLGGTGEPAVVRVPTRLVQRGSTARPRTHLKIRW